MVLLVNKYINEYLFCARCYEKIQNHKMSTHSLLSNRKDKKCASWYRNASNKPPLVRQGSSFCHNFYGNSVKGEKTLHGVKCIVNELLLKKITGGKVKEIRAIFL